MAACGLTSSFTPRRSARPISTPAHEALLLPYEQALTRLDSTSGDYYACSAHFLWIGDRTRQLDGAHVEFLRGVQKPDRHEGRPEQRNRIADLLRLIETAGPHGKRARTA